jgi:hypothetical protein
LNARCKRRLFFTAGVQISRATYFCMVPPNMYLTCLLSALRHLEFGVALRFFFIFGPLRYVKLFLEDAFAVLGC